MPSCNVNTNDAAVTKWEMLRTSSCEHLLQHLHTYYCHTSTYCYHFLSPKKEGGRVHIGNVVKYEILLLYKLHIYFVCENQKIANIQINSISSSQSPKKKFGSQTEPLLGVCLLVKK